MKQVVQSQSNGRVRVEDVPRPALRSGSVLVRTAYSLISAGTERAKVELARKALVGKAAARPEQVQQVLSSIREQGLMATYRRATNRLEALEPLGYSSSGIVVTVTPGAEKFAVKDRVCCAGGGYANHAEEVVVPKNLCAKIPLAPRGAARDEQVHLDEAAFATVGAIALHAVRQADVRVGENVAVIGLGLVGLLAGQILQAAGCRVFGMDPNPARCRLAADLGCEAAESSPEAMRGAIQALTSGLGVDAAVLTAATSSNEPLILASGLCRDRGRVVIVGDVSIDVPRRLFYNRELELRISRSYGPGRYDPDYEEKGQDYPSSYVRWTIKRNLEAFLYLVAAGKVRVRPLITHRFPIENAEQAYDLITTSREPSLGVLLDYGLTDGVLPKPKTAVLHADPQPQLSRRSSSIGVGFIGIGSFAQNVLLPALKRNRHAHLRAVTSSSGLSARSAVHRFGFDYSASDAAELLLDPKIKVVIIVTRHETHAPFVIQALQAGKSVFVEKPLALDRDQLQQVCSTYRDIERKRGSAPLLMVGFNRRFAPSVQAIKDFFSATREPLSVHYRVNAGYLPPTHWLHDPSIGGGRLIGEACHFIDLLMHIVGSEVTHVFAHALPDSGKYHQDNVTAQLQFANGSIAVLQYLANGDKRAGKERIEVFGGGATAVLDDFCELTVSRNGRVKRYGGWFRRQDKGHVAEVHALLDAVAGNRPSPVPFDELVHGAIVTLSALDSVRSGVGVSISNGEVLPLPSTIVHEND